MMTNPEDILAFWLDEKGPEGWYMGGDALDQEIRDKFEDLYNHACEGALSLWLTYPTGTLAYIILLDQFSRNMFRDTPKAFATDGLARAAVADALERILMTTQFTVERKDVVRRALADYADGRGDFADGIIGQANREAGCTTTITFDRALKKTQTFQLL